MIRHMKGVFAASLLLTTPLMASPGCLQPRESVADQVRYVQTHLNVAALLCRGGRYSQFPRLYNRFIVKNRHHLINGRAAMETIVGRLDVSLDTYLTRSFNRVSFESTRTQGFCDKALMALKQTVASPDPLDMLPLLPVAYKAPQKSCAMAGHVASAGRVETYGRKRP